LKYFSQMGILLAILLKITKKSDIFPKSGKIYLDILSQMWDNISMG
jgi:hypothetical protein